MKNKGLILGAFLMASSIFTNAQITVTNTQTPEQLVNDVLVGSGVVISNVEFNTSTALAAAVQPQIGYFNANTTGFALSEGIILATGNVPVAVGPNDEDGATLGFSIPNTFDADLDAINTASSHDQAILEFDFVPAGDSLVFNYIFASEEYAQFVGSRFNDVFGFFISGPGITGPYTGGAANIALVPGTTSAVAINNVNNGQAFPPTIPTGPCTNCAYYVHNHGGTATQFNAYTTVLTAAASVQCGETYHIKIAICDAGDPSYDSGVFLEASSFSSNGVQVQIASATGSGAITEACDSAIVTFIRPADQVDVALTIDYTVDGTATNGDDYPFLPGTITFPIGVDTVQFYVTPFGDGLTEGTETVILSVSIINECGDTVTTEATIEITDPLPFNVVPGNIVLDCPVDFVDITATTDGGVPGFSYEWQGGSTATTLTVPGDIDGVTSFDVDITDACGTTESGTVTVTLNAAPIPTIDFNFNTITICPNDDALVIANVVNPYGSVTYSWSPDPGTNDSIIVSPNVPTWYYLTINDGCYDVIDSMKVEMGNVDLTALNVVNATNCPGLPGTPGSLTVLPNDPTFEYTLIGGGSTFGPQSSNVFNGLAGGVIYFLNVTDADGCSIDTTVSIGMGSNPVTADWEPAAIGHVTCFGDANGTAAISNIGGGVLPPYVVSWTHTTGLHDQNPAVAGAGDSQNDLFGGTWVVTVTDVQGCAWSHLFTINEPGELTVDFNSNAPTCYQFSDGSVTALTTGGNGGNTFTMTDSAGTVLNIDGTTTINNLTEGWYITTIVDSQGCDVTASIFIDDPDQLDIDLDITNPLCYGIDEGFAIVSDVYNYTGSYDSISYFWNPNPSGINGIGQNFSGHMGPGNYILTINDENGCSRVFDFVITYPDELVFSELGYVPAQCRTLPFQSGNGKVYAAATGGTGAHTYLWTNDGTGATSTNTTWGGLNPGSYTITVTDAVGCVLTQTVQLDSVSPIAEFEMTSPQFIAPGVYEGTAIVDVHFVNQSLHFTDTLDPNGDTTFYWNFNRPVAPWYYTTNYLQTFDTSYTSAGIYEVCLAVFNKNNCTDTMCKEIIVHDPLVFTPINIFTPNGDGINDGFTFFDRSQAVETFEAVIVNRWGTVLFEMNDITDVWYGTDKNGDRCTDGVYFYTYKGVATNGEEFDGQGTINIVDSKD